MNSRFDPLARAAASGLSWRQALRAGTPRRRSPGAHSDTAFDHLTRSLAEEVPRREALRRVGLGLASTLLASLGLEQAWAACPPGTTPCGKKCVNLQTDRKNCGSCGNECGKKQSCVSGACTGGSGGGGCPSGQTQCGTSCVNLQTDAANCGSCSRSCPANATCSSGQCVCPSGGFVCGSVCCAQGGSCVNGTTCIACTSGQYICGNTCCNLTDYCMGGTSCCPPGRVCQSTCCPEGQICQSGNCCRPSGATFPFGAPPNCCNGDIGPFPCDFTTGTCTCP